MGFLNRLRNDFQLGFLVLFAGSASLGILPFVVFRLLSEEPAKAAINLGFAAAVAAPAVYGWATGRVKQAAFALAMINIAACLAVSLLFGRQGLLWAYLVIVTSYMLLDRRQALAGGLVLTLALLVQRDIFASAIEMAAFAITAGLLSLYSFVSAWRTERQQERLRSLATRDPLTGAGNRRLMEEDLSAVIAAQSRHPRPMVLAIIDIDHFKRVNDAHGHEAGDRVLVDLSAIIESSLRRSDRLYRFGGEEFVVTLANATPPEGKRALEKLHDNLQRQLTSPGGPVGVSIGASVLEAGEDWTGWLGRADAALYRAKRGGRARLVFDDMPVPREHLTTIISRRGESLSPPGQV